MSNIKNNKTVYPISLGCPKNLVDSEVMLGTLKASGYEVCDSPEEASLLLVNTCGFIKSAVEEAVDQILEMASHKEEDPSKILAVTGCLVQRYGIELQQELPEVDLFIGTDDFPDIVNQLARLSDQKTTIMQIQTTPRYLMDSSVPRSLSTPAHRVYMKITEGCSNCCTYCMIPALRGSLRSRTPEDLLKELKIYDQLNIKELNLIAQDLTSYGRDFEDHKTNLVYLLREILKHSSIPWIRLLYLYPVRITDELLDLIAENPRIVPYLDIPLQHVSDKILSLMNRPYCLADIEKLIERIRKRLPESAIRTTFIVGFPGESEEDVDLLASFIEKHKLEHVGVFTYSNEEGCQAEKLANHCSEESKENRRNRLMALQAEITAANNSKYIGKTEKVLVEGISRETDLLLEGRTKFQAPDIDGCVYINSGHCQPGDIVDVTFSEAHIYDLVGEISGT